MNLSKSRYLIAGGIVLFIVLSPIIINFLMGFRMGTVYGDSRTWITFFGSYLGAVVSGLITILGVYMTIRFTQEQNRINLEVTQKLNAETLKFTQKENRREKLPIMIHNLEECLDFIRDAKEKLEFATRESFEEILFVSIPDRKLKLHYVNDSYHVAKKEKLNDFTKNYLKEIRNYTVKVNPSAYSAFLQFSTDLEIAHGLEMYNIETEFINFQTEMMNDYMDTDDMTLVRDDGKLTDIDLTEEDEMVLQKLKRNLYDSDREYLKKIIDAYNTLYESLEEELLFLITEFND